MNISDKSFKENTDQLILICSNSCELGFRKDKGSVFLLLNICDRIVLAISSLDQVNSRLELVHGVEDHLQKV